MHPELHVPIVGALRAYPTAIAIACIVGGAWGLVLVRKRSGVSTGRAALAAVGLVLAALLGARLHYALLHWSAIAERGIVDGLLWGGRMHIAGGLLALAAALPLAALFLGMPVLRLADAVAPAAALTFGAVRLACLLHGCCFGAPSTWPWALRYPADSAPFHHFVALGLLAPGAPATMPVHPLPLYFAATGLLLAVVAARTLRRARFSGEIALLVASGLSLAMAALEPLRAEMPSRVYWGPLPQLLWVALTMCAVTMGTLLWAEARHRLERRRAIPLPGR